MKLPMPPWHCVLFVIILSTSIAAQAEDEDLDTSVTGCCPPGQGLLSNHTCIPYDAFASQPLISFNKSTDVAWDFVCDTDQVLHQVSMNEIATHVLDNKVILAWLPPQTASYVLVDSYCMAPSAEIDPQKEVQYVVAFCHKNPLAQLQEEELACQNATCVRKCCPNMEIFNGTCQPTYNGSEWKPLFKFHDDETAQEPVDLLIVNGFPQCPLPLIYDNDYSLLKSGMLDVIGFPETIPTDRYCIDLFAIDSGETVEKSVICQTARSDHCWWKDFLVDTIFMSISCVFLATTWVIYVCIRELRTNTHGRCMISFITALFVAFVSLIVNRHMESFSAFQCSLTGVLTHFSILATFFWLNILSYHIWNCLRSSRKPDEGSVFLAYCLYGWGCPLLVSLVGVILDATKADVIRPHFVLPHCWFNDRTTKWVYQYGFMLVLLLVNFAFFLSSAFMLAKRLRQTQDIRHHSERLWLYLKLFIIMGITWLMELITWLLEENPCTTWITILDGITALHGVYIFLVTVCFRSDLRILRKCFGRTYYDVDGNTVSCTRDNFVELLQ